MGGGNYARFWKYKSPVFIGGLVVFGVLGGLTGSCADGEGLRVAVGWAGWAGARKTGWSLRLRLRSGLRQSGRAVGPAGLWHG